MSVANTPLKMYMKDAIKYYLIVIMLLCSCSPIEEIFLDCNNFTVDSGPKEISFQFPRNDVQRLMIALKVNGERVGHNENMTAVHNGVYDYTVLWSRVKYDVNDDRSLKVYLDENDSGQPRTIAISILYLEGTDSISITQKSQE